MLPTLGLEVIRIKHQSISAKLSFNSYFATIAKWSSVAKISLIAFAEAEKTNYSDENQTMEH